MRRIHALLAAMLIAAVPAAIGEISEPNNSTHLDNLDDLLSILENVEMVDLINLAAMNDRFSRLIADHIITHKYLSAERQVHIQADDQLSMWYREDKTSWPFITDATEEVFSGIQYFGHLFKHLKIYIHPGGREYVKRLQFLINKHCADAIQKIQLIDVTDQMDLSFPNASDVTIGIAKRYRRSSFILPLETVFPRMQSLRINTENHINQHFPHLEKIAYDQIWLNVNLQLVLNFVRANPQLRSFHSDIPNDTSYLSDLNAILPNLEKFSVRLLPEFFYDGVAWPIIRLKNVRHFIVTADGSPWMHSPLLESIQFDQLESFEVLYCLNTQVDFLIILIVNNTAVQNVVINEDLSFEQLSRLTTSLQELKELTISWERPSTAHEIIRFLGRVIASNHGLVKLSIRVTCSLIDLNRRQRFLESIPRGWTLDAEEVPCSPKMLQIFRAI